jgi:hypothetical protein
MQSQDIPRHTASFPSSAAIAGHHVVKMLSTGKLAVCPVADVTIRVGVSMHAASAANEETTYCKRGTGAIVEIVASATCTPGALVLIGATPGQVEDGATNPVGICVVGAAVGQFASIQLI